MGPSLICPSDGIPGEKAPLKSISSVVHRMTTAFGIIARMMWPVVILQGLMALSVGDEPLGGMFAQGP